MVMDKTAYITEAYRQLNNNKYYKKLETPIFTDNINKINAILDRILDKGIINPKQYDYLAATMDARPRVFYLLPKIHKDAETWPQRQIMPEGRPIVSDCGSESYRVSEYIDYFLTPLSTQHPSYLKDTYDFISKIRDKTVGEHCVLVTGDVSALYTNMNLDRIISVVRQTFNENPDAERPTDEIIELLELTLKNNDFEFNQEYFLQVHGTAMGKKYAPALANLYLVWFDRMAATGFRIKPDFYFRFLDDIFLIWNGSSEDLIDYQAFLNNLIPDIKVTLTTHSEKINFLDTTVYIARTPTACSLQTKVYFKPTDTHQLLHTESFHPKHTTRGVLKSQVLRFKRLSSTKRDFDNACYILFRVIEKRGYSRSRLRKMKREIWSQNISLIGTKKQNDSKLLPIVLRYNQLGHKFMSLWKGKIAENNTFDKYRIVAAYKRNRNLGDLLVRSKLYPESNPIMPESNPDPNPLPPPYPNPGFSACGSIRCMACRMHCIDSVSFRSTTTNICYNITHVCDCSSTNIVYLITCGRCNVQYVGETSRSLRQRLTDHRSNIKTKKQTPIGIHFNSPAHTVHDLKAVAIELITQQNQTALVRKQREEFWQLKLKTKYPYGLNGLSVA